VTTVTGNSPATMEIGSGSLDFGTEEEWKDLMVKPGQVIMLPNNPFIRMEWDGKDGIAFLPRKEQNDMCKSTNIFDYID